MSKYIKLGQRFGRLTVIEDCGIKRYPSGGRTKVWKCLCDCGNETVVITPNLNSGRTQSCGCYKRERNKEVHTTHKGTNDRLYKVWAGIKKRCNNPNNRDYKYYGGAGVQMCDEWLNDYGAFREWAVNNGYDENADFGDCTIDRIDLYGNYEPSNCRWVDMVVQNNDAHKRKAV